MADNNILTPGGTSTDTSTEETTSTQTLLVKDNYFSEFATESEKSAARENLEVYPKSSLYTQVETDTKVNNAVTTAINTHLAKDDPHGILPQVDIKLEGIVKNDGSTPFLTQQTGVDPIQDMHLVTKRFVTNLLNQHLAADDPHSIMIKVRNELASYVKLAQVYLKNEVYTQGEVNTKINQLVRKDGSTPFTAPQTGVDPTTASQLATKRSVDAAITEHVSEADPHGFLAVLNQALTAYYKKTETYTRSQLYTKAQIDAMIKNMVYSAAVEALQDHLNATDPHNIMALVRAENYIKQDGTTPFTVAQKGIEGTEENDLVVYSQLTALKESIAQQISDTQPKWTTSGPSQAQVGLISKDEVLPSSMTLQEAMDAIFYGSSITITAPEYGNINEKVNITLNIRGSLGTVESAQLLQDGYVIGYFTKQDFETGHGIVNAISNNITKDTVFTFKVIKTDGAVMSTTYTVKASSPMFVGIIPYWYVAYNLTYDYLKELVTSDPTNNKFEYKGNDVQSVSIDYNFTNITDSQTPVVVIQEDYNSLYSMESQTQQFGLDAFNVVHMAIRLPNSTADTNYKIYVYKQPLVTLDTEVTFKFKK